MQEIEKIIEQYEKVIFDDMGDIYDQFPDFDNDFFELREKFIANKYEFEHELQGDELFSDEFTSYINVAKRIVGITEEIEFFDPHGYLEEIKEISKIGYYNSDDFDPESYVEEEDLEEGIIDNMFPNRSDRTDEDSFDDGFDVDDHFGLD